MAASSEDVLGSVEAPAGGKSKAGTKVKVVANQLSAALSHCQREEQQAARYRATCQSDRMKLTCISLRAVAFRHIAVRGLILGAAVSRRLVATTVAATVAATAVAAATVAHQLTEAMSSFCAALDDFFHGLGRRRTLGTQRNFLHRGQ